MTKKTMHLLARALQEKTVISFSRPFESGYVVGCVIDIGPKLFMVAHIGDHVRHNGFQCFYLKDVRNLQAPYQYADFINTALAKRGEQMPGKPKISMENMEELLQTASRIFPLVTIHCEKIKPEVCHVGRVVGIRRRKAVLQEIGPDAIWDNELSEYRISDITRVDFGGGYEEALLQVGGPAPIVPV